MLRKEGAEKEMKSNEGNSFTYSFDEASHDVYSAPL